MRKHNNDARNTQHLLIIFIDIGVELEVISITRATSGIHEQTQLHVCFPFGGDLFQSLQRRKENESVKRMAYTPHIAQTMHARKWLVFRAFGERD
jgi:hypothetical protein